MRQSTHVSSNTLGHDLEKKRRSNQSHLGICLISCRFVTSVLKPPGSWSHCLVWHHSNHFAHHSDYNRVMLFCLWLLRKGRGKSCSSAAIFRRHSIWFYHSFCQLLHFTVLMLLTAFLQQCARSKALSTVQLLKSKQGGNEHFQNGTRFLEMSMINL